MVIQELTDRECRALLATASVARLACAQNNQPYVVPVHVDFDSGHLYGYATLGMKIEWMRQNPLVCLEIDDLTIPGEWASLVIFGRYEELPPAPAYEGSRTVAERLFQRHPMWWEPASVPLDGHERRSPIVYRINIDRLTGRRARSRTVPTSSGASRPERPGWLARVVRRAFGRESRDTTSVEVRIENLDEQTS
jgi:hypothetical protein